jgi:hypothetical protein
MHILILQQSMNIWSILKMQVINFLIMIQSSASLADKEATPVPVKESKAIP